jgi:Terminase large subunit, T4likevirus-type, N-terminal
MRDFIASSGSRTQMKLSDLDKENTSIWNTQKINQLLEDYENGMIDIKTLKNSPFKDNDPVWKKANIVYEYTPEELEEIKRCKADPVYFASKYAQVMTEDGIQQITLRDYQEEIIRSFKDNRFNCLMASRQIGKTVMSGVFIAWYLIFHTDKNVLAVANVASTTKEVLDKIKSVLENVPFFLKPGCISNNVMSLKFDNGCRLIGRTTTKNTGIGFTIHVLYIDEFAHINPAYLDFFYRAIYPTISASSNSKVIITSTPNGMNRFYEIYMDAINGLNTYTPLRVDWWQVPGRDDEWKKMTIANLGSEEDFNQEYGLQFFSSDKLLLPSKDLKKIFSLRTTYVIPEWTQTPDYLDLLDGFSAHPNFSKFKPEDIKNDGNFYIFSIDTASGVGRDYSVINIFKLTNLPIKLLDQVKDFIKNEGDFFGLVQVATFRSNKKDINEFCNVLETLAYKIFNPEKVRLVIELDHKGDYVMDKITQNEEFWPGQVVHSKHTSTATAWKAGLKMTETNKTKYCERFKYLTAVNKILPNEFKTVHELGSFGKSSNGTYRSQNGNDDLAMTCVSTAAFFESTNFWELVNEMLDILPKEYLKEVYAKYLGETYVSGSSGYDHSTIRSLNKTPELKSHRPDSKFDENTIELYKSNISKFYGS